MISCHWECIIIKSLNTVLDAVLTSVFMQLILSVNNVISAARDDPLCTYSYARSVNMISSDVSLVGPRQKCDDCVGC